MKKQFLILLAIFLALSFAACHAPNNPQLLESASVYSSDNIDAGAIVEAYGAHRNLPQVQGSGVVVKLLKDDTNGLQHQKFLLKVSDNITILIAHNIDLAPRVDDIHEGDTVSFKGEYVYTPKGGTVHWTHKDPRGNHAAGWLEHKAKKYE
ncbi:MAG: DUF3465 domain-containing protein [Methylotenera sp.]|uniref:DUF3465 domain-containing protein n=1 Tax=Methylotenera sp. TaxID=2051956 RepID=UPI00248963FB|nr:DUF3465 domain-containing protein [Methylotenera sp.]MDI1308726.1 DUF3465 domain-containing protein [Methylotenera sp.]